ncbi:hypothetical protein AYO47_00905 [Planctomyces sp. SCGC AG-212-M04]|nr:hypothetical protein AYO47_00905 [Planctomyces sp. SCGC AG-212-M04]
MTSAAWLCLALLAAEPQRAVDFDTEIIPVLMKAGCNAGACHGAAAGRGGFHLSLLGGDATSDYDAIVHAFEGRRINLAHPESSLLLRKSTGEIEHGGDAALEGDGPGVARLLAWIRAGAPRGSPRRLTSLDVSPRRIICRDDPTRVPLKVTARFDDGPPEDVTAWTTFASADRTAVDIVDDRTAEVHRHGQHDVVVRFLDRVVTIQFSVPFSETDVNLSREKRAGFIDDEVLKVLSDLRLPVSPPASEAVWLRRVTLDLTGRLPEPSTLDFFLNEQSPEKRERIVDSLLSSDAFADYWTLRFARLLRLHSLPNDQEGVRAYASWLHRELARGTPLNQMARDLLTATGDSHVVGPANFGRMVNDARGHAELVGQFFMGVRLGCANCHNHPLDQWTQDDYHGLAAVFARLDRGQNVQLTSRGAVTNLRTNEPAIPRIPGFRDLPVDGDHREEYARWLTSDDNRYFARATVNRLWRAMFGRGLVEPTDDLRTTSPATHPELLDRLADDFVQHDFSIRRTLKLIALSTTYGRSGEVLSGNELDDRFYSHSYRRPLEPEILADAIAEVTGVADEFAGQPAGTRAVTLIDPLAPAPSLDVLGRCTRAAGCEEGSTAGGGLPAQLHLLNGDLINRKLTDDGGRLHRLIAAGRPDEDIVREFYVRALGRRPSNEELMKWQKRLATEDSGERTRRLEDFVWSLLNSREFRENH